MAIPYIFMRGLFKSDGLFHLPFKDECDAFSDCGNVRLRIVLAQQYYLIANYIILLSKLGPKHGRVSVSENF